MDENLQLTRNEYHDELAFMIALQHYGQDRGHLSQNFATALQSRYRAELYQMVDNCMQSEAIASSMSMNRFVVEIREEALKHNNLLLARHYVVTRTTFLAKMLQRLEKCAAEFYLSRIFKE